MNNTNKFLFDLNNFDSNQEEVIEEIVDLEPPPPVFSEDELEAAKAIAHAAGHREGQQEEKSRREQHIADTLKKISDDFSNIFAAEIYRERQYEEESLKLALQIVETLAPSLQTRLGEEALKKTLVDVLKKQAGQSEINIEVHPETAPDIDRLIEDIWLDKEAAPRYKILANTDITIGACRLSWKDGGMVRAPEKTANDIKTALEALLVEQVLSKKNSALTTDENNGINKEQSSDSTDISSADNPTGENGNE